MASDDDFVCLTFNGEIYNAPRLREGLAGRGHRFVTTGDTEVLLRAYEQWGSECVDRLEGMFAFAVWDGREGRLILVRDRLGMKPLYYSSIGAGIAFASEAASLATLLRSQRTPEISSDALAYVLAYGYVPAPHAIWAGMCKLEPGHVLEWRSGGRTRKWRYWEPPRSLVPDVGDDGDFGPLFEDVVRDHLLSDVPVTVFLSGGNDSMATASATAAASTRGVGAPSISAFTVGFGGGDDETPFATAAARHLGLEHVVTKVGGDMIEDLLRNVAADYDEPVTLSATMSMHQLCRIAAGSYKVALSGDGGDEVFGGYNWYRRAAARGNSAGGVAALGLRRLVCRWLRDPLRHRLAGGVHRRMSQMHEHAWRVFPRFLPEEVECMLAPTGVCFDDEKALAPLRVHDVPSLPLQRRLQRIDLMTYCADLCCAKIDRSAMAHGLEVRTPFLDRRIVEWGLSRPQRPEERETGKLLIKKYLGSRLPPELVGLPKRGFSVPVGRFISGRDIIDRVRRGPLVTRGFVDGRVVDRLDGRHPATFSRLWMLYSIGLWLEQAEERLAR